MNDKPTWDFADGWILMSIFLASSDNPAPLEDIIGAADASNHAIPTASEFTESLSKLLSQNIIVETIRGFSVCKQHLASLQAAYDKPGGLFKTPDKGLKWLTKNWPSPFEITVERPTTEEQVSVAYLAYRKERR